MYDLVAVVIHCGSGPNRGHYISIVKSSGFWLIFDDDIVDVRTFFENEHSIVIRAESFFPSEERKQVFECFRVAAERQLGRYCSEQIIVF
jgi:uncharacterized UBP type Zn finger protein